MLTYALKVFYRERFQMQMSYCAGFAITRQIQKHVLVTKALSVLVLDEWATFGVKLDFATEYEVHDIWVIATPVKNIPFGKFDVSETVEHLPHEVMVFHLLEKVDSINQLSIRDQENLVT